ncbi:MAG: radical SAM protein [Syntrophales bacterium]
MDKPVRAEFEQRLYQGQVDLQGVRRCDQIATTFPPRIITWSITSACNFKCRYCFAYYPPHGPAEELHACNRYNVNHIVKCFDHFVANGLLEITGGEPFLARQFIPLCQALTERYHISIRSNFSTDNLRAFADAVDPAYVKMIHASLHIEEREKIRNGMTRFIDNVNYFQDKGFRIRVEFLLHPTLFNRVGLDIEHLRGHGVKNIGLKVFRGYYQARAYPKSYSPQQKEYITHYGNNVDEVTILRGGTNFLGMRCLAGTRNFVMDAAGNITRCRTSEMLYGNLFQGTFRFDHYAKPCPYLNCTCPYQGLRGTFGEKVETSMLLNQFFVEIPSFIKSKMKTRKVIRYLRKRYAPTPG